MLEALRAALGDRYAVERELGRGGMASVWLARDLRHDRPVAIKVVHPELAAAIGVERFVREIRLTANLQHPNIIPLIDSGSFSDATGTAIPWYAMAYVPGESLRDRLDREGHLPIDEAVRIAEQVAAALDAAHGQRIVHRDIKPENLLLDGDRVYVADFGIAKALIETGGERLTSTGFTIGTPAYMSPEQATAEAVDARSDQYSLACVLYEMLVGEPPFTGPTAQAVVARRLAEPARGIRVVRSAVPPGLEAALLKALERFPADRFPDVMSFARALADPRPTAGQRSPSPRRNRLRAAPMGVVAAGLALGLWALLSPRSAAREGRDAELMRLYQRGVQGYDRRTPDGIVESIQAFRAALARDSSFALAWAGLAKAWARAWERGFEVPGVPRDSAVRLAVAAVDRALALDRENAEAWLTRAIVARQIDPTSVAAPLRALAEALRLDSTNGLAWHTLALSLAEAGRLDSAVASWRRAVTVEPTYTQGLAFLAQGHYWQGQYDSAAAWADSALALDEAYLLGWSTRGYVALERGETARALAAFEAAIRLSTGVEALNGMAGAALVHARAGRPREARALLARIDSAFGGAAAVPLHPAVWVAQAWTALGDRDRAIAWLSRFSPVANLHFQLHLRHDPPLDPLSADGRFQQLLAAAPPR